MLHAVAYVSRALVSPHSVDILDIARSSMRNNAAAGVTGALYFDERQFCQVLEGEHSAVETVFRRILADPRHCAVSILTQGPIVDRRFPGWSMKFIDGAWTPDLREALAYDALHALPPAEIDSRLAEMVRLA